MNLNDYQKESAKLVFANDRDRLGNITLWALGVTGEAGEVAENVKRVVRGDCQLSEIKEPLKKEIGDVLWYLAQLATEFDLSLDEIAQTNLRKIRSRLKRGTGLGRGDNR